MRVGREFVVFGKGNLISNQRAAATPTCCPTESQDGVLVTVDVTESKRGWRTRLEYWPTWVRPGTYEVLLVAAALGDPSFEDLEAELQASWERTTATVGRRRLLVRLLLRNARRRHTR